VMIEANAKSHRILDQIFREMEKQARVILRNEGFADRKQKHERSLAVRYKGQSFELQIKQTTGNIAVAFHRAHQTRYGYAQAENAVEIVSARVRSSGIVNSIKMPRRRIAGSRTIQKPHESVEIYSKRKRIRAAVYQRDRMTAGSRLRTPCIMIEYSATTLVPADVCAELDEFENLIIDLRKQATLPNL
jgi:N-methylhydantoinase A